MSNYRIFFYNSSNTEESFRQIYPLMKCLNQLGCDLYHNTNWIGNKQDLIDEVAKYEVFARYRSLSSVSKTIIISFLYKDVIKVRKIIGNDNNYKVVYRPRGISPEESFLKHRSYLRKYVLDVLERRAINASDYFCFICENQRIHFASKYYTNNQIYNNSVIVRNYLPFEERQNKKSERDVIRIVYSGGFSKWQQIDSVFKLIHDIYIKMKNIEFNIYTLPKNKDIAREYANKFSIDSICNIQSFDQAELPKKISDNDVGIIMRNSSIVNIAATPFKVMDYLDARIGVIMSDNIGDYSNLLKDKKYIYMVKSRSENTFEYSINSICNFIHKMKNMNKSDIDNDLKRYFNLEREIKELKNMFQDIF